MRILLVSPYFPPEGGGLESYILSMAEDLSKEHEIRVICLSRGRSSVEEIPLSSGKVLVERIKAGLILSNTPISARFVMRLFSVVKSWKPDLMIAHTPVPFAADVASLASMVFDIPLIVVYHTLGLRKGSPLDALALLYSKTLEKLLLSRAKSLVSVSPSVRDYLRQRGLFSIVVPPRPRSELFRLASSSLPKKEKAILFVGQLSSYHRFKNFELLLRAFAEVSREHPDWILWVAGGGDLLEHYRAFSKGLGISDKVMFFGPVAEPEKLADLYRRASILVLPSSFESFGLVVVEGMLFGAVPVVSLEVAGNFRGSGLEAEKCFITLRQKSELPSLLNELLSDPKALKKVSGRAIGCGIPKGLPPRSEWARLLRDTNLLEKF